MSVFVLFIRSPCSHYPRRNSAVPEGGNTTVEESASFISCTLQCTGTWIPSAVAWVGSVPVAWAVTAAGVSNTLTVFGSPFGAPTIGIPVSEPGVDASLLSPYPLLGHVSMLVNAGTPRDSRVGSLMNRAV